MIVEQHTSRPRSLQELNASVSSISLSVHKESLYQLPVSNDFSSLKSVCLFLLESFKRTFMKFLKKFVQSSFTSALRNFILFDLVLNLILAFVCSAIFFQN